MDTYAEMSGDWETIIDNMGLDFLVPCQVANSWWNIRPWGSKTHMLYPPNQIINQVGSDNKGLLQRRLFLSAGKSLRVFGNLTIRELVDGVLAGIMVPTALSVETNVLRFI
jgi:hypothetical protein